MTTEPHDFPQYDPDIDYTTLCYEDPIEFRGGEINGAPYEQPSLIKHLLKQLRPGQDLTRTMIPVEFLDPRSLLERFGDTLMHIDILDDDCMINGTEEQRFMNILKWYLSAWHYKAHGVKKPYNPIIGECYSCICKTKKSTISYIAEQVSHHPPVSAFYLENQTMGYCVEGYIWTKSQFTGNSALCGMVGECTITLPRLGEVYKTRIPNFSGTGLFVGKLALQLIDDVTLSCEKTGYSADIHFHAKPFFGEYNVVKGCIKKEKDTLSHFEGKWDTSYSITDAKTSETKTLLDVASLTVLPKLTLKEEYEGLYESRRLWLDVTKSIRKEGGPDWNTVAKKKAELEESQRLLPCHQEGDKYKPWETKFFDPIDPPAHIKMQHAYVFKYKDLNLLTPEAKPRNFLALCRNCNDPRGNPAPLKDLLKK
ncbi:hypothetical protein WA158_008377 [Blastocystis sp. Blastoise]